MKGRERTSIHWFAYHIPTVAQDRQGTIVGTPKWEVEPQVLGSSFTVSQVCQQETRLETEQLELWSGTLNWNSGQSPPGFSITTASQHLIPGGLLLGKFSEYTAICKFLYWSEKQREKKKGLLPFLICTQQPELDQPEARNQGLNQELPGGLQEPNYLDHQRCTGGSPWQKARVENRPVTKTQSSVGHGGTHLASQLLGQMPTFFLLSAPFHYCLRH